MKKHILLLSLMGVSLAVSAQTFNSGYFLDGYNYGNTINPAFQPDAETRSYFGFAINNMNVNAHSNVGASSFLFPVGDDLVFGLNKKVPAETFLGKLKDINLVGSTYNQNLLNFGVHTSSGKGFFTFDLGIKGMVDAKVPKSLFEMLKVGVSESSAYEIKDVCANTNNYIEFALGYSQQIGEKIKIGARAKLLAGLGYADVYLNSLSVKSANGDYLTSGKGSLTIACPLVKMDVKDGRYNLQSISYNGIDVGGLGVAFDLGITYSPIEDLTLDFAVQDIGSIKWDRNINGLMDYTGKPLATEGKVDLDGLLEFKPQEKDKIKTTLPITYRLGAKYNMPFYKKLSARLLGSYTAGNAKYYDVRFGATVTPVKQISATANCGITTYGPTMGAAINFNLGFFNLFLGADSIINKITPQYLPVNPFNLTISGGITIQMKYK